MRPVADSWVERIRSIHAAPGRRRPKRRQVGALQSFAALAHAVLPANLIFLRLPVDEMLPTGLFNSELESFLLAKFFQCRFL
jgi:hypothetical protein